MKHTAKIMETNNQLTENAFVNSESFEMAQRMAKALASSGLIPKDYQNNIPNTMIALELSNRTGVSPIMVMQNLHVIQGKPSWSSSFIIAIINSYKKFSMPLNFRLEGEGDSLSCVAFTTGIDGQIYESPKVNIQMAKDEGWFSKSGSKWKTMPELMIRYRAAAFFGRLYCPEVLMGMQSEDEIIDVVSKTVPVDKEAERITLMLNDCKTPEDVEALQVANPDVHIDLFSERKEALANAK